MSAQDFLFELGTEELPPKSLKSLSDAMVAETRAGLEAAGLRFAEIKGYAAPRRLAVLITGLEDQQPDRPFEKRGPAVKAAWDSEGKPSKAAQGFARSCGVDVEQLETQQTEKGDYLVYQGVEKGHATTELLPNLLITALDNLPIAKRMRWGSNRYEFVRPVKWLLALWGDQILPMDAFGLTAGDVTYGHRIHAPDAIRLSSPTEYASVLKQQGWVLADFAERRDYIRRELTSAAEKQGVTAIAPDDLLDEVTSLNEWPVVLSGQFEQRFLDVPAEALVSSMQEHQKYFAATNNAGELVARFFFVANLESQQPQVVVAGNEKVIRPRLADAAFFWQSDQKTPLQDRLPKLDKVVFQKRLGSIGDKSRRISALSKQLADMIGADSKVASRAGLLAKADLVTDLVFEFDDLQGLAGYYYARKDGEGDAVALAIRDQYRPGFAGDQLPETLEGCAVALADRLDTLVGIFGIGQKPTGTKDPFALRRASLGVLRILMERQLPLDLRSLLKLAHARYDSGVLPDNEAVIEEALAYILERLRAVFQDNGISTDVFYAVRALKLTEPLDIAARVDSVNAFKSSNTADSLCAANKRVANLLSKAGTEGSGQSATDHLKEPAELALLKALQEVADVVPVAVQDRDYDAALTTLSRLKEPLDDFFDQVMVMSDNPVLKTQRLNLLRRIRELFLQVADISLLQ